VDKKWAWAEEWALPTSLGPALVFFYERRRERALSMYGMASVSSEHSTFTTTTTTWSHLILSPLLSGGRLMERQDVNGESWRNT